MVPIILHEWKRTGLSIEDKNEECCRLCHPPHIRWTTNGEPVDAPSPRVLRRERREFARNNLLSKSRRGYP